MSKVSFRARALDSSKPMPVFRAEEIPDLPDFATINRSVPQMPTGMEKEEESEHHLQRALSAQQVYGTAEALVIPIPEVVQVSDKYETYYKEDFKPSKQYIHVQAFNMEQEIPDYDMDSEDEAWLNEQAKKMEITPLKFEEMLDRLEKGSGQQVVTLQEAKLLLKEDDDLIIAVYDYWLNKRLRTQHPLILQVKTEKRDGSTTNNPYVAFRRRTEKMQTRKNRKNDEASYEKMLKLRRDLYRAVTLLEMIKRREKTKKEMLQLTIEILEKRYQLEDFHGQLLADAEAQKHSRPSYISPYGVAKQGEWPDGVNGEDSLQNNKKRIYRKRKHRQIAQQQGASLSSSQSTHFNDVDSLQPDMYSSDEEGLSPGMSPSDHEDENDPDGQFAFRRKKHCNYYAPMVGRLGNWPWCGPEEGGLTDKRFRFSLMSLPPPHNCISYARRRVGRGGRILVDRAFTPQNAILEQLDLSSSNTATGIHRDYITYIRERKIPHYTWRRQVTEESRSPCFSASTAETTTTTTAAASSTAATTTTNSASTTEFNFESFQNHREEILLMQQKQRQRLESSEADNFQTPEQHSTSSSNHSSSHLTLDSASAKFAVSAVRDTTQLQNSSGANSHSSSPSLSSSLSNGPITDCKDNQFSTSQTAAVLQLNLNQPSHSSDSSHLPSGLVSSSVVPALNNMTSSKVITSSSKSALPVLKLSAPNNTTTTALESFKKQTYEDGSLLSNYSKDRIVPMDVT